MQACGFSLCAANAERRLHDFPSRRRRPRGSHGGCCVTRLAAHSGPVSRSSRPNRRRRREWGDGAGAASTHERGHQWTLPDATPRDSRGGSPLWGIHPVTATRLRFGFRYGSGCPPVRVGGSTGTTLRLRGAADRLQWGRLLGRARAMRAVRVPGSVALAGDEQVEDGVRHLRVGDTGAPGGVAQPLLSLTRFHVGTGDQGADGLIDAVRAEPFRGFGRGEPSGEVEVGVGDRTAGPRSARGGACRGGRRTRRWWRRTD